MEGVPDRQPGAPGLRLHLLGSFRVWVGERLVQPAAWRRRRSARLVQLLALAPARRLHRDQLIERLWPDDSVTAVDNSFAQTLYFARRTLEPELSAGTASAYLTLADEHVALCPDVPLWLDIEAFEAALAEARGTADPAAYRRAIDLYRGDLLADSPYDAPLADRRTALRSEFLAALLEQAQLEARRDEPEAAIVILRRLLAEDPAHEPAHQALMRLFVATGRRHEALRQFQTLATALQRDLDAQPSPASRRLYEAIAAGAVPGARRVNPPPSQPAPSPPRTNLPYQTTSFVGRECALAGVRASLETTRLLTLTGAGGIGKTRLALHVAERATPVFPAGVWLVELAGLTEAQLVPQAVATTFGVQEEPGRPLTATLVDALRPRRLLLVLDNCEHLVDACARLAEALLRGCPDLTILATSREALAIAGETTWRVPPLSLPAPAAADAPAVDTVGALQSAEAVRLFVERARSAVPGFCLTDANAPSVIQICRRLDGIPLAIELAAVRVKLLGVEQLATRLDDRFRLLTAGSRTALQRHQTLRGLIDWSYDLLVEPERALLRAISVFAGSFSVEAVEAVAGGEAGHAAGDLLSLLAQLVEKSLVVVEEAAPAPVGAESAAWRGERTARYRLLETVRQYAWERLVEIGAPQRGDAATVLRDRHLAYYLRFAEAAEPALRGPDQLAWLDQLEAEHDNLRAALTWSLAARPTADPVDQERARAGVRLAGALHFFWILHSHLSEMRTWIEAALACDAGTPTAARARVTRSLGGYHAQVGNLGPIQDLFTASIAIARAAGADRELGWGLCYLAVRHRFYGRPQAAIEAGEEAVALFKLVGDPWEIAWSLYTLGTARYDLGECQPGRELIDAGLVIARDLRERWCISNALAALGRIMRREGNLIEARAAFEEAVAQRRELGDGRGTAHLLGGLALVVGRQGDLAQLAALSREGLLLARDVGDKWALANALQALASVARRRGDLRQAARLFGAEAAIRATTQTPFAGTSGSAYAADLAAARAALAEAAFEDAWRAGHALSVDQSIAEALDVAAKAEEHADGTAM